MITTIILTKNEEENIEKCIKSVLFSDEIILIDDYSTDFTIRKIEKTKADIKIYRRHLNNDFASQRNFGISKSKDGWVLFIDADEIVSKSLQKEILFKTKDSKINGYYLRRKDYFLGQELKHGETGNIKLLRLARKNSGKWKRNVHEYWDIKKETEVLNKPLLHYSHKNLSEFITDINYYSTLHAIENKKEGKTVSIYKIIMYPAGKFMINYIYRLGFLDGAAGFMMAVMMSFHSFLAWSKLYVWKD